MRSVGVALLEFQPDLQKGQQRISADLLEVTHSAQPVTYPCTRDVATALNALRAGPFFLPSCSAQPSVNTRRCVHALPHHPPLILTAVALYHLDASIPRSKSIAKAGLSPINSDNATAHFRPYHAPLPSPFAS